MLNLAEEWDEATNHTVENHPILEARGAGGFLFYSKRLDAHNL